MAHGEDDSLLYVVMAATGVKDVGFSLVCVKFFLSMKLKTDDFPLGALPLKWMKSQLGHLSKHTNVPYICNIPSEE